MDSDHSLSDEQFQNSMMFSAITPGTSSPSISEDNNLKNNGTLGTCILDSITKGFSDLRMKVSELTLKINQMEKTNYANQSNASFGSLPLDRISEINDLRNNVSELASKVNQLEKHSNMPLCDHDWVSFGGSCYYFSYTKANWNTSRYFCLEKKSDLAVINSEEEQSFLQAKKIYQDYWIGLSDTKSEGVWKWVDGTDYETSYKYWNFGEPNDHANNEDCAHVERSGKWNDRICTHNEIVGVCEKKIES
ncbi:CD209 antigen-like protein C isoform 2-T2 [Discoglossus pictus]